MTTNPNREWIDADKLRDLIKTWRQSIEIFPDWGPEIGPKILNNLEKLLPTPQPRTLADMTPEEREACRFMAAEVATGRTWYIIGRSPGQYGQWIVVTRSGRIETRLPEHVVPLPDLPRLEWPDEQATEEDMSIIPPKIDTSTGHDDAVDMAPEDVPEEGPWIVDFHGDRYVGARDPYESPNCALAQPEDVPAGEAWIVTYLGEEWVGTRASHDGVWSLARMDGEACRYADGRRVTLVSRLVPEVEE